MATHHRPDETSDRELLTLGSDLRLRNRFFVPESLSHPAKLHLGLLHWILETYTRPGQTVADPMADIGSALYAATLGRHVIAREIESRWLEIMQRNAASISEQSGLFAGSMDVGQGNAREPWGYQADHIIVSPPYGNEANTTNNGHRGLPYVLKQAKGVTLSPRWEAVSVRPTAGTLASLSFHYGTHPDQIGHFRGKRYWFAMTDIYTQARNALRPGGLLILILKDHIAQGKRVETGLGTIELCTRLGFELIARHQRLLTNLSLWQRRRKEQGLPVVEEEDVLVFRRASLVRLAR